MATILDRFLLQPDIHSRHEIAIHAPADVVMRVARNFDMQSIVAIRAIFWLRAKLLGARGRAAPRSGLVADMLEMGWGRLAEEPGRFFVAGAACQPWVADVVFTAIAPEDFAAYGEPDCVKITWTLEAESLGPEESRFATETRASATDEQARGKFRRYWRMFRVGILTIRRLLLPAIRRGAEREWGDVCRRPNVSCANATGAARSYAAVANPLRATKAGEARVGEARHTPRPTQVRGQASGQR